MKPYFSLLSSSQQSDFNSNNNRLCSDDESDDLPLYKSSVNKLIEFINRSPNSGLNIGDDIEDTYGITDISRSLDSLDILAPFKYANDKESKPLVDTFCSDEDIIFLKKSRCNTFEKSQTFSLLRISEKKTKSFHRSENFEKKRADKRDINAFVKSIAKSGDFIVNEKSLFWYNYIHWERLDQEDFIKIIKRYYPEDITIMLGNNDYIELFKQIRTEAEIQVTIPSNTHSYYINFLSGVYDIRNDRLLPHRKDFYFFNFINYHYTPTEKGGYMFERYISSCSRENEAIKEALMQMLGYIISDLNKAKSFFILLGDRDSGKSTFGNLITEIIGEVNRSALNFHDLAGRWTPASLHGKKLVLDMDVSAESINKNLIAMVNKLTGSDPIIGEEKFKNSFTFINTCKILIAANTLPTLSQSKHEEAFLKRMVIIPFGNTIPDDQKDPDLLLKLTEEMDYIITQAMKALRNLIKNNFQFPIIKEAKEEKEKITVPYYINKADTIKEFLRQYCIFDPDTFTTTQILYERYKTYLYNISYAEMPMPINHFGIELSNILGAQAKQKIQQQRGFRGIKLRDE